MNREPKVFTDGNEAAAFCCIEGNYVYNNAGEKCGMIGGCPVRYVTKEADRTVDLSVFHSRYSPWREIVAEPATPELPELSDEFKAAWIKVEGRGMSGRVEKLNRATLAESLRLARAMVREEIGCATVEGPGGTSHLYVLKPRGES